MLSSLQHVRNITRYLLCFLSFKFAQPYLHIRRAPIVLANSSSLKTFLFHTAERVNAMLGVLAQRLRNQRRKPHLEAYDTCSDADFQRRRASRY